MLLHTVFYTAVGEGASGHLVAGGKAANDAYKEMIGQTFAVLGLAIANISLGIFLLRIVVKAWHRISIWIAMVSVSLVSIMMVIVLWIQRTPTRSIYDPSVPGRTLVPVKHFSLLLGCMSRPLLRHVSHQPEDANPIRVPSMVYYCGLLFCDYPMGLYLGAEHEVQRKVDHHDEFQSWLHVHAPFCPQTVCDLAANSD